ncbi:M23 family metallopeptidase [Streptomyces sp. KR80]|uniref:M23 family metallopeptidase n=1 Tax=Streptomyces sp. KR80 TaxID=3457426 RepID=UPI003FD47300
MTKLAQKISTPSTHILRRRAAVVAAGLGGALVLGTGVALATAGDPAPQSDIAAVQSADSLSQAVRKQAEGQKKAAAAQAAAEKRAAAVAAADRKKRAALKPAAPAPAAWVKPVDNYIKGSTFGLGGKMWSNKHSGQDLVVPSGTSVKAVHAGTVVDAGWGGAYGNNIVIKHADRTYTQYAHLSVLGVQAGQTVTTGQEIGKSGSTGNSSGPHLHFETRTAPDYGYAIEPLKFLRDKGVLM